MQNIAATHSGFYVQDVEALLKELAAHPELSDGITDISQIENNTKLISRLLTEIFPPALTLNEIKAVSIPYLGLMFNYTERFKKILSDAGPDFEINIRDFSDHQFYIASCCLILNRFYNTNLDLSRPLFYDIPTADGVTKHYRILYNADFIELLPTKQSPQLSAADIKQLLDNYSDLELWKKKIPAGCYILKGFAIMTLVDATVENAVSNLKGDLLSNTPGADLHQSLELILRSIYKIPDLRMGLSLYEEDDNRFTSKIFGQKTQSYLLPDDGEDEYEKLLCNGSYQNLITDRVYFSISDVSEFMKRNPDSVMGKQFKAQKIKSFILAPVVKDDKLLAILELVSPRARELNSVNANKLEIVMPFLVDTIDRKIKEFTDRIESIIQHNYTTLHPSVNWKFKREAQNYIKAEASDCAYTLKEISFKDVFPLYGQVDIKDSSITRNSSVKNDLKSQIIQLIKLMEQLYQKKPIIGAEQNLLDLKDFLDDLAVDIKADTEQNIHHYLDTNIYPLLKKKENFNAATEKKIAAYFKHTDPRTGDFYSNRRNYETTLFLVNEKLTDILDKRQGEIQEFFPHYFERFKTDGVEHSLYIGDSISPNKKFKKADLRRLRMWQMIVTVEMEIEQHHLKNSLPYPLGVTSLILVFSNPIAIRFRMDEKHFDIDGAYNIRYEVIKKRIDKAHVKHTEDRISSAGKITIVYSKDEEEQEYREYIAILQAAGLLKETIDSFDVEDLQGVSGLRGLRVGVVHNYKKTMGKSFSYEEIYKQLQPANVKT